MAGVFVPLPGDPLMEQSAMSLPAPGMSFNLENHTYPETPLIELFAALSVWITGSLCLKLGGGTCWTRFRWVVIHSGF